MSSVRVPCQSGVGSAVRMSISPPESAVPWVVPTGPGTTSTPARSNIMPSVIVLNGNGTPSM